MTITPFPFQNPLDSDDFNDRLDEIDAAIGAAIANGFVDAATTLEAQAASGQKVLNTVVTTGFIVGDSVWIGTAGSGLQEMGVIFSISAGVSLTLVANLANTHAIGTPVSRSPAEIVNARGTFSTLGARIALIENRVTDVKRYGAVGNDSTDDTTAIQSAIDATGANGTVYFPAGTYKITALLNIATPMRLQGAGSLWGGPGGATIHQVTANTGALNFSNAGDTPADDHEDASEVFSLKLLGPSGASAGRGINTITSLHLYDVTTEGFFTGVYIGINAHWSWLRNCVLMRASSEAFHLQDSNNCTLDNVRAWKSPGGIRAIFDGGPGVQAGGLRILNSNIEQNTVFGIAIDGYEHSIIQGCYLESWTAGAPDIQIGSIHPTLSTIIESCHITGATDVWHVMLDEAQRVTIIGTTLPPRIGATGGSIFATSNTSNILLINSAYGETGNISVGQLFDLTPTLLPHAAAIKITAGDYATTSTSFVDVDATNLALTISTGARRVLIGVVATGFHDDAAGAMMLELAVDGANQSNGTNGAIKQNVIAGATDEHNLSFQWLTDPLTVGNHTFKLRWRTASGWFRLRASGTQPLFFFVTEQEAML